MRIKTVLIAIGSTALLFTSCEKEEMKKAGAAGTGKEEAMNLVNTRPITSEIELPQGRDTPISQPDSLSYN